MINKNDFSVNGWKYYKKYAFSVVNFVIILIILIPIVLILSLLISRMGQYFEAKRINNIEYELTQATTKMVEANQMENFKNAYDFVQVLQKYYPVKKVCNIDKLKECWPYSEVNLFGGKVWNIEQTITGDSFRILKDENNDYSGGTAGVVTKEGIPIIFAYNKNCPKFNAKKNYPYIGPTNATTSCIAAVFDTNGARKPNKLDEDVILFHANGLGIGCAININGKCFGTPFSPVQTQAFECMNNKDILGLNACSMGEDYLAVAIKKCGGIKNLPSEADLISLAKYMYNDDTIDTANKYAINLDKSKAISMGFTIFPYGFYIWSGEPIKKGFDSNNLRMFTEDMTLPASVDRKCKDAYAFCLNK